MAVKRVSSQYSYSINLDIRNLRARVKRQSDIPKNILKSPAYLPSTFYLDLMKHFEKSSALFLIDRSDAKGIGN